MNIRSWWCCLWYSYHISLIQTSGHCQRCHADTYILGEGRIPLFVECFANGHSYFNRSQHGDPPQTVYDFER